MYFAFYFLRAKISALRIPADLYAKKRFLLSFAIALLFLPDNPSFAESRDTAFDFLDNGYNELSAIKNLFPPEGEKDLATEAAANFAIVVIDSIGRGGINDAGAEKLLKTVQITPSAKLPVAMLMAYWLKNSPEKFIEKLMPVAEKHPEADALAIALSNAYLQLNKTDDAVKFMEKTISVLNKLENYDYSNQYVDLIGKLANIYAKKGDYSRGEELFDEALEKPSLKDNFKLRRCAFIFFSRKAEKRDFSFFSGWQERRFYEKMMENFSVMRSIWITALEKKAQGTNIHPFELAPIIDICKKNALTEGIENMIFEKLIDSPNNLEAKTLLAKLFFDTKNFQNSRRLWSRICEKIKSDPGFFYEYGRAAIASKQYKEAIKALDWAGLLAPGDKKIPYMAAVAEMDAGNCEKAIAKFERIKDMPEAWNAIASCYRKMGQNAKAADAMDTAEKIAIENNRPDFLSRDFYFFMTFLNDRAKRLDKAVSILKMLYKDYPNDHEICNFLGYILADNNMELDFAQALLEKAIEFEPENAAYLDSIAWVFYKQNKSDNALEFIKKAWLHLEDGPDAVIADHTGDIYYKLGNKEKAIEYWKTASEIFNDDTNPEKILEKIRNAESSQK
jgi:tetratricopeptide (TPR) repeat protein